MRILRDRWRRTAWHQYFAALEPIDRATFWIAVALGLAVGFSVTMLARSHEAQAERFTAPPFLMDFAAVSR